LPACLTGLGFARCASARKARSAGAAPRWRCTPGRSPGLASTGPRTPRWRRTSPRSGARWRSRGRERSFQGTMQAQWQASAMHCVDSAHCSLVPGAGIEPARLAPRDFKSLVSTSFTIRANVLQRFCSGSTMFTSSTSMLSCLSRWTLMSSGLTETYLEITSISSRCSAGRKSAAGLPPERSWAISSDRRFLAISAVFFFSPNSLDRKDMSLSSEQALDQAGLLVIDEAQRAVLAEEAADHVGVGLGNVRALEVDGGCALVRCVQHRFGFWDDPDQRHAQQLLHVLVRQHLAVIDALGRIARDQQVLLDRLAAFSGALGLALQDAEDAVRVAHRRDLGVGGDDGFVGEGQRHHGAALDTGGGVAHHVVEGHVLEIGQHLLDAFLGQRILVARLRGGEDEEVLAVL